ncbi:MAG: type II toxin-antitoxin system HicB family antitoxin [Pseudodesulfovibrio sp.]|uniref:type II toxin-antitoxin system HicB family antitoxin n=1 Tax=Pseudodesulfovibrio sp. TaxID=2035812 RepID=UPI003D12D50F
MKITFEFEQEDDGRWIVEVPELPGVMAYGLTKDEALDRVTALGMRVLAERIEAGELHMNDLHGLCFA